MTNGDFQNQSGWRRGRDLSEHCLLFASEGHTHVSSCLFPSPLPHSWSPILFAMQIFTCPDKGLYGKILLEAVISDREWTTVYWELLEIRLETLGDYWGNDHPYCMVSFSPLRMIKTKFWRVFKQVVRVEGGMVKYPGFLHLYYRSAHCDSYYFSKQNKTLMCSTLLVVLINHELYYI